MFKFLKKLFSNSNTNYYFYDLRNKTKILLPIKEKLVYETKSGNRYAFMSVFNNKKYHIFVSLNTYSSFDIE